MNIWSILYGLRRLTRRFSVSETGNTAIMFAVAAIPIMGGVGAAVDYTRANSVKASMQGALDATALALVKTASSQSTAQLTSSASTFFAANFNRPEAQNIQIVASYDSASQRVTVTGSGYLPTSLMGIMGIPTVSINGVAKAALGGTQKWAVCVLITNPDSNHTLLVKDQATIDFTNCMVQVNTANWDAVEARDTSYIHSVNGVNCFTGDIHYGDVTPPKQPTCDMLSDPYASYSVPSQTTCDYTNLSVTANSTLSPGVYCGGLKITGNSSVTLSPGVYYIQNGDFQILNTSSVSGNGVTFLISGQNSNINFTTTGTINLSPYTESNAGQWAGFLFFWDQPSTKKGQTNTFSKAQMNLSGILYFVGQTLSITNGAQVTVNTGSIISDFLLPDGATLNLTGTLNSPTAAQQAMQKSIASTTPVLVQ
jgi:Flp pilus assembly protein TadG